MKKEKFSESAYLYLLNELNAEEKIEFENLLMQDNELKSEFDKIKEDLSIFSIAKHSPIPEADLVSVRNNLFRAIRNSAVELQPESLTGKFRRLLLNNYNLAFGGIATFALGIGIGYMLLFSRVAVDSIKPDHPIEIGSAQKTQNDNANFSSSVDNSDERNEINQKQSTVVKENNNELDFKHSLIAALLNQKNPGIRIKSISTLADHAESETHKHDVKIKNALLKAMKEDANVAVRIEALNVLKKYPFDNEIRDAFLTVLANDKNSGMRVLAINALSELRLQGILIDEVIKQVLTQRAEAEKNTFVKYRAASILKEVE